jgi:hypothetical protein
MSPAFLVDCDAGVVDPLVFEADINALLAEQVSVQLILPVNC